MPLVLFTQRVVLLEAWKALEAAHGDSASLAKVEGMMPRVVKKMRKVDGDASMMEECKCPDSAPAHPFQLALPSVTFDRSHVSFDAPADYDMIFADDEQANKTASLKFLQLAAEWKRKVRISFPAGVTLRSVTTRALPLTYSVPSRSKRSSNRRRRPRSRNRPPCKPSSTRKQSRPEKRRRKPSRRARSLPR